ncbi:hypothetical protein HaLaN_29920 [Haematococcus lacustris]|uniref:Uncharacterized protein n=1 Tax=Haematococcus lacustris TaxID=44745 RepID=A0A6A0ADM1_HAELA|nr:hypothetical protein HaLaN_29920 [Haematococcus lacustris]
MVQLCTMRFGAMLQHQNSLQSAPISVAFVALAPANYSASTGKRRVNPCIRVRAGASEHGHTSAAHNRRCRKTVVGPVITGHCIKRAGLCGRCVPLSRQSHRKVPPCTNRHVVS